MASRLRYAQAASALAFSHESSLVSLPALIAIPIEVASLWRLNFLSSDDISAVCLRWLEEDLNGEDPDIASLAAEPQLSAHEAHPNYEAAQSALAKCRTCYGIGSTRPKGSK